MIEVCGIASGCGGQGAVCGYLPVVGRIATDDGGGGDSANSGSGSDAAGAGEREGAEGKCLVAYGDSGESSECLYSSKASAGGVSGIRTEVVGGAAGK